VLDSALRCVVVVALLVELGLAGSSLAGPTPGSAAPVPPPAAPAHTVATPTGPLFAPRPRAAVAPAAPAAPLRLLIASLHIDAPVQALGVDAAGALETPANIWDVGWYRAGPSPGAAGDAVIDGHVGLPGSPLVFSHLGAITVGAQVIAVLADGSRRRFSVTSLGTWPATSHPPDLFASGGAARLSLITCTGLYDGRTQTYADRLIVQADYIGPA